MVLPGQRDGSLLWHKAITGLLKSELDMAVHEPYPCILKNADSSCIVLIHVDDILVVGKKKFVMERLVKCLEKVYTISTQYLEKPGDELSFLKRTMTMQNDGRVTMQVHHKHVQHLCDLLQLNPKLQQCSTLVDNVLSRYTCKQCCDVQHVGLGYVGSLPWLATSVSLCLPSPCSGRVLTFGF